MVLEGARGTRQRNLYSVQSGRVLPIGRYALDPHIGFHLEQFFAALGVPNADRQKAMAINAQNVTKYPSVWPLGARDKVYDAERLMMENCEYI